MTLWTVARQAPLSMGFPRQEYWSGLLFLSPGDLPDLEIEPVSPTSQVLAREGAGCGSVGDVPGAWLASAPLWPSLWT